MNAVRVKGRFIEFIKREDGLWIRHWEMELDTERQEISRKIELQYTLSCCHRENGGVILPQEDPMFTMRTTTCDNVREGSWALCVFFYNLHTSALIIEVV